MSPTKRTSTSKRTSKAYKTTWLDSAGVRHQALAKRENNDLYLIDVFLPCAGYHWDALALNIEDDGVVTCLECLTSGFDQETSRMNLDAIENLDEPELVEHLIDHDAMAPGFDA